MQKQQSRGKIRELIAAGVIGAVFMAAVQSGSRELPGNDGYYHLRMAALLPDIGFTQTFPWLRWTILADRFVSHHHGFHVLLAPFAVISERLTGNAVLGGKFASIAAIAVTCMLFARLLQRLNVQHRLLWLLLFGALPWHFWLRMAYVRAPMAALPLLLLAVIWITRRRVIAVGILAFVFTHVYGGGVIFPLVPMAFLGGHILCRRPIRDPVIQCLSAAAGITLGLVVNPYFPANISFLYTQLFQTGLGASKEVGNEWQPYQSMTLLGQAAGVGLLWMWCLIRRLRTPREAQPVEIALLLLNLAFFLLTIKSRRFIEYWPVFALLSAAQFLSVPIFETAGNVRSVLASQKRLLTLASFGIVLVAAFNLGFTRSQISPSHDVAAIQKAMEFLKGNSDARSLVFTDDWDIFPTCFYFNQHNVYAVGLDPEFTRSRYPALWERYRRITRAQLPAKLSKGLSDGFSSKIRYEDIASVFEASYVLVAEDHKALFKALKKRPRSFTLVFPADREDESRGQPEIAIFRVKEAETLPVDEEKKE